MLRIGRRIAGCVALAALSLAACSDEVDVTGSAACAAPDLRVEPATVARAEEPTVSGTAFSDGCADSCSVNEDTGEMACQTSSPRRGITVELVPDDSPPVTLARVDADEDGAFTVEVTVPADAPEGRASVTTDVVGSEPAELTIVP